MTRQFYSKAHYARVSPPKDTAEQIAWRVRHNAACDQAISERKARYPQLTADNFDEASEFQERRTNEILAGRGEQTP